MNTLLRVQNLSFSYGKNPVFSRLSFKMERGTVTCLLGPNGCGKTTLIDSILGFLSPQNGSVFLQNRNLNNLTPPEVARLAAYVPQHHEKHFPFSVLDVILMGRTAHLGFFDSPGADDREKVMELLARMGMSSLAERDYRELSGGETQIVLILRALIQESPLIVMDEPTSHLDFKNELILLEQIMAIAEDGDRGVLMSTHSPNQALFLENRGIDVNVLLMDEQGNILRGRPSEVLTIENMASLYGIRAARLSCPETAMSSLIPLEIMRN